jgi:hypothetical protein
MVTADSFPGVKLPGHEADNSPSSNAEIKKMWTYTSILSHLFIELFLIKGAGKYSSFFFSTGLLDILRGP